MYVTITTQRTRKAATNAQRFTQMNTAQIIKNMMNITQEGIYDAHAAKALALSVGMVSYGDINPAEIAMSRTRDTYSRMKRMKNGQQGK